MIPFFKQEFNEKMKEAAIHALENERFVLGESVFKFEEKFAKYCNTKYAIAVNSGTSALKIALLSLGLKRNEKVLTTPFSFIATANSIIHAFGQPIFSDINSKNGSLDETKLNKNAKGIIPVHLYGQPCAMDEVNDFAKENNMFVVEDACQAHGAEYKGKKAGNLGDAAAFSFYASKNMNVGGDGGMITTSNEELAVKAKILRDCGRLSQYEHSMIGYTDRLNTVSAAIGLVQLEYLDKWNAKREKISSMYRKSLPKELLLENSSNTIHSNHLFVLKVKNKKEEVIKKLKESEIQFGVHYPIPIHLQKPYRELYGFKEGDYPVSEKFCTEIVSIPIYPKLSLDDAKLVCEKINEVFQ